MAIGISTPHAGCSTAPMGGGPLPLPSATGMPIALPAAFPALGPGVSAGAFPVELPAERFLSSMSGGVILNGSGAPAGRVAAGSFVDTKDGTIYGPDGAKVALPAGGTVDFFDLPDLKQLIADAKASNAAGGPAMKGTTVSGQWGPGGTTDFRAGSAPAGCDMPGHEGSVPPRMTLDRVPTHDPMGTPIPHAQRVAMMEHANRLDSRVAGASGGGHAAPANLQQLQMQAAAAQHRLEMLHGHAHPPVKLPTQFHPPGFPPSAGPVMAGGLPGAVAGASGIGMTPGLQQSLVELVTVLRELTAALATVKAGGAEPVKAGAAPAKTEAVPAPAAAPVPKPVTETKVEPSSSSSSGSSSSSSAT